MKESEGWTEAIAYIESYLDKGVIVPHMGLCAVLYNIRSFDVIDAMQRRIHDHLEAFDGRIRQNGTDNPKQCFAYPMGEDWDARLLAAYWMRQEAMEEENGQ